MSGDSTGTLSRSLLFAWQVSADQEEPWRRFLQELSGSHNEKYIESRRRQSIFAESVWFAPKPNGGGIAVVWLEAEDPKRALRELFAELAAPENSFDSWLRREMHELFGCDFARLSRVVYSELLFTWREASGEGKQEIPKGS
jgi:hypothetical protein